MADFEIDTNHYFSKARRLFDLEEYDKAIISGHLSLNGDSDDIVYFNIAIGYCMKGDFRKASKNYAISLAINPNSSSALNGSGSCLFHLGKYHEAILKFKKTVEIDSKYTLGYLNWGLSLYCLKEEGEALVIIEEAFKHFSLRQESIFERYKLQLSIAEKRLAQVTNEEEKALLKEQISACDWILKLVPKKFEELKEKKRIADLIEEDSF